MCNHLAAISSEIKNAVLLTVHVIANDFRLKQRNVLFSKNKPKVCMTSPLSATTVINIELNISNNLKIA